MVQHPEASTPVEQVAVGNAERFKNNKAMERPNLPTCRILNVDIMINTLNVRYDLVVPVANDFCHIHHV
ncbi:MAG: hypothetical protein KDC45_16150 [Bacteroidetes bacterium]|nr:hypothetical protein [Bacteroidota bacterium]